MNSPNKNQFSSKDFIQYHEGKMSENEMHQLEIKALEDNFLSDALEGYSYSNNAEKNLLDIRYKLDAYNPKSSVKSNSNYKIIYFSLGIAASIILILFAKSFFISPEKADNIPLVAKIEEKQISSDQSSNSIDTILNQNETSDAIKQAELKFTSPVLIKSEDKIQTNDNQSSDTEEMPQIEIKEAVSIPVENSFTNVNVESKTSVNSAKTASQTINVASTDKIKLNETKAIAILDNDDSNVSESIQPASPSVDKYAMKNKKANYSQESYPANGWSSYNDEINENKKKITNALGISCKGLLILSFSIDDQGTPVDFKITQPINNECDNAGVKIISDGPKWIKFNDKRIVYQIEF